MMIERTAVAVVKFFPTIVVKQFLQGDSEHEFEKEKRILRELSNNSPAVDCFCKGIPINAMAIKMERWPGDLSMFIGTSEAPKAIDSLRKR